MTRNDKDTGVGTTGHVWDGIEELNNPLPRWWVWVFYATIVWAVVYTVALPGLADAHGRRPRGSSAGPAAADVAAEIAAVDAGAAPTSWPASPRPTSAEHRAGPRAAGLRPAGGRGGVPRQLRALPRRRARRACRRGASPTSSTTTGSGAAPSTTSCRTVSHGIRNDARPTPAGARCRPSARSWRPAEIDAGGRARPAPSRARSTTPPWRRAGAQVFADNCAACHGEDAHRRPRRGRAEPHGRDLALRRRPRHASSTTVREARFGVMPAWSEADRPGGLSPAEINAVAAYVHCSAAASSRRRRLPGRPGRGAAALMPRQRRRRRPSIHVKATAAAAHDGATPIAATAETPDARDRLPLRRPRAGLPAPRVRAGSGALKWGVMAVTLGIYYLTPWLRWDRGPDAARPGGAGRPGQPALLLLLHRDLAARVLLRRRPADHGGARPVPLHLGAGPGLVRLRLPADGLDRPLHPHRALGRGRPQRPRPALERALVAAQGAAAADQVGDLAASSRSRPAAPGCSTSPTRRRCCATSSRCRRHPVAYVTIARPDRHHLRLRRLLARAGLHLHLPLAAHPGGDDGRGDADRRYRDWRGEPRGAATRPQAQAAAGRPSRRRRLRRLHAPASTSARWASTSATASRSSASPAPLHRRLRRRHGQARAAARPDRLLHPHRRAAERAGGQRQAGLAARPAAPHRRSTPSLWSLDRRRARGRRSSMRRRDRRCSARAGPQPGLRHALGRLDPQRLRPPHPQQALARRARFACRPTRRRPDARGRGRARRHRRRCRADATGAGRASTSRRRAGLGRSPPAARSRPRGSGSPTSPARRRGRRRHPLHRPGQADDRARMPLRARSPGPRPSRSSPRSSPSSSPST